MSEDQNGNLRADFLEDASGNRSSGRLIKVAAFILAATLSVLIALPAILSYIVAAVNPGYAVPEIPPNVLGLFQTIFYGLLGVAIGAEAVQKITNH
jgi:uncharacterized membrane protein